MALGNNASDAGPNKRTGLTYKGKEIILARSRGTYQRQGLVKKGIEKGIYPDSMKLEAVVIYAATGNLIQAASIAKVPVNTLKSWRTTQWFQDLLKEVREENNEKIDAKFTEIVEKSLEQLVDRVENGDYHVLRDGTLARKPVSAKDLSLVSAINIDKRQLLRGEATSRSESVKVEDNQAIGKLEKLAETFENLARFGRQPKVIEHDDHESVEIVVDGTGSPDSPEPEGNQKEQVS